MTDLELVPDPAALVAYYRRTMRDALPAREPEPPRHQHREGLKQRLRDAERAAWRRNRGR